MSNVKLTDWIGLVLTAWITPHCSLWAMESRVRYIEPMFELMTCYQDTCMGITIKIMWTWLFQQCWYSWCNPWSDLDMLVPAMSVPVPNPCGRCRHTCDQYYNVHTRATPDETCRIAWANYDRSLVYFVIDKEQINLMTLVALGCVCELPSIAWFPVCMLLYWVPVNNVLYIYAPT